MDKKKEIEKKLELLRRMKFLGKEMKFNLDLALNTADDAFKTYKEKDLISYEGKIQLGDMIQMAQLITLLDINDKLDKLNK